ncbi:MAG: AtpZ/AtpI family protein [Candidatus Accumulibacter sp.]|uniref:AtpZ/AtpI family protein n=1 Tax=Accumulibacter sp. TaxID=2053492 RepID=UPI0019E39BA7|nr:AtpZ/AtpI family protein [Accumulibacter sp.]MBE2259825.1 AtpZ/AtpI family protein [Paracoccaceae bacterium]MCB1942013.1 AtpZ/AtpI family protein [Accumulibacter sp.]MCP5249108.1 AtpZ/AtpI family protein [Accumulibacter sp.]
MTDRDRLLEDTSKDVRRLEKHEQAPATWVGIAFYGGTVGLLFVVPIVGGAYLGRWLDSLAAGYSVRWTVSLIVLGIALGAYNAYHFMRGRQ